jgi:hypothetical protein
MTTTYATKLVPLDEAIQALDAPEAGADRKKRAKKLAEQLVGDARQAMIQTAERDEIKKACAPIYRAANTRDWNTSGPRLSMREAEKEAGRNMDALVWRQCEEQLRREEEAAIRTEPDRQEESRIWNLYTRTVAQTARAQGNKEHDFVRNWRELVMARNDAVEFGDDTGAIEGRLGRLVGVPYPVVPKAAWDAADLMPASERQAEVDRLTAKYGEREQPVTTDTPTRRRGRK